MAWLVVPIAHSSSVGSRFQLQHHSLDELQNRIVP
jgi:hypothetical protein